MAEKLRIYLETSFMFYLTGRQTSDVKVSSDQAYTRRRWEEIGPTCELYTSEYVIQESEDHDPDCAAIRAEKIAQTTVLAAGDPKAVELARRLLADKALPPKETTDAFHVAVAAVAGMDYLLSWNCRHLANPKAYPKTRRIVESFGLTCPAIITPRSYLEDYVDEEQ